MKWEEIVAIESTDEADKRRKLKDIGIDNYKKLKGILAGVEYFPGCISPTQIGLVRSAEEWRKIARNFSSEEVVLRFDSKSGDVSQFISSQAVRTDMLGWYLEHPCKPTKGEEGQIEQQNPISLEEAGAIAIIEEFDNMELIDRVKTLGAFNITINYGKPICLEWVGEGFDGRELCQGEGPHFGWEFPWEEAIFLTPYSICDLHYYRKRTTRKYYKEHLRPERVKYLNTNAVLKERGAEIEGIPEDDTQRHQTRAV